MEIEDVRAVPLAQVEETRDIVRTWTLIRTETADGTVGWGEASTSYGNHYPLVTAQVVESALREPLVGGDPTEVEALSARLKNVVGKHLGTSGPPMQAISGVEVSLWDLRGKHEGKPVSELVGGHRERVPVYLTGKTAHDRDPQWHYEFFEDRLDMGFDAVKLRIGKNPDWDVELVETVRERVGEEVEILTDGYLCYDYETALAVAERLAEFDVAAFEEPIDQSDHESVRRLAEEAPMPLAYGEHLTSHADFEAFDRLTGRQVGVLQPDATVSGGIRESLRVGELAAERGAAVFPHVGGLTAVGVAANLHLASAIEGFQRLEMDGEPDQPLRDEVLADPLFRFDRAVDGQFDVPTGPGLGIEVDESALAEYRYEKFEDRIENQETPDWYDRYYAGIES